MSPLSRLFGPRIETRFISTISLVVAIALVALIVVVSVELRTTFSQEVGLRVALASLAAEHSYPDTAFEPARLPPGILYLEVRGARGNTSVVSPGYRGPVLLPEGLEGSPAVVPTEQGDVLLFQRTVRDPSSPLSIWVALSERDATAALGAITLRIATVGAAILISCYFLGAFLARTLLRPLSTFTSALERVGRGDLRHMLVPGSADDFGQFSEAFNVMVDQIRKSQEMERALLARDKMATVGQLAAAVAHETRNPLAAISSLTQMLAEEVEGTPRLAQYTKVVLKEVARLDGAIGQLLEYARPPRTRFERVKVGDLLDNVAVLFGFESRRRGLVLERTGSPREEEVPMLVDPNQITQTVVNLVANALAHSPVGGRVVIGDEFRPDGPVRVFVADQGPGVPEDLREKIFQPFFSRRSGGTGLGLAIARKIAELHCGKIWVESAGPEGGARFVLELPRLEEPPEPGAWEGDEASRPGPWPISGRGGQA